MKEIYSYIRQYPEIEIKKIMVNSEEFVVGEDYKYLNGIYINFDVSNYIKKVYNKGKERTIILRNDLKRDLKNYCKRMGIVSGYIFVSSDPKAKKGAMWNNSTIWRRLKKIAKAAKINSDKIHPHAWRHLFAKKAKESGIDLDELQDILGHADIKTTAIYTMTSNREKKQKLERLKY